MSRIHVVLHRPIYSRNVGMCARAMANMDASRLIIVGAPGELTDEAKQGAAHAQSTLRNATIYASLKDFLAIEGDGLRIALSGKDARLQKSVDLNETLTALQIDRPVIWTDSSSAVYLMFGPEDDGLSAEEMEICHHVCRLPTFGEITSLNLSHAVLLTAYLVRTALEASGVSDPAAASNAVTAVPEPAYYPSPIIHAWLEALGFDLSSPRINIEKTLNRLLLSKNPSVEELKTLNTVLHQTVRKLNER